MMQEQNSLGALLNILLEVLNFSYAGLEITISWFLEYCGSCGDQMFSILKSLFY